MLLSCRNVNIPQISYNLIMKQPLGKILYDHQGNQHGLVGPATALPVALDGLAVSSLLDVGSGTGTWLAAARELGIKDLAGIDGIIPDEDQLHVKIDILAKHDFRQHWDLNRKYDIVLCLEVAEHLEPQHGALLVECIVQHTDVVLFSAAAPFQDGDHHTNCQWPYYWQAVFNQHGFICNDAIRWKLWNDVRVEPWYRQNLFMAKRSSDAGSEARLHAVYHPEMIQYLVTKKLFPKQYEKLQRKKIIQQWFK